MSLALFTGWKKKMEELIRNQEQLPNNIQNEISGTEVLNRAADQEKVMKNNKMAKVNKKRKVRKLPPKQAVEGDVKPQVKKRQRKRVKASVHKTSLCAVQDPVVEGTEHMFRTHICTECRRCFKTSSHLREHLRLHFPDPSLQCPVCKRFFTSKSKLRVHMLRESGEKLHQCHLCEYGTVELNTLRRHLTSVHGQQDQDDHTDLYTCPTCQDSFCQSRALKDHMKSHHVTQDGNPLACFQEDCAFKSTEKKLLQKHLLDSHGIKAVECNHHACCALFKTKEDMETHFRTHQAFHCTQCDFSCSNKSRLQQHRRQGHAGETQLRCSFCPFTSFNPVEFEHHIGYLHANEKTHKCQECSFVTAHKRVLKRHMLMHTGEKPHKCSLCEFRCRDETYLSKHMLTHSNDKQHMCSECGYVTKWKHYLNVHMRKHTGDLRYKCNQCMYRCHRVDQLNSHKLRHQAKSLICEVCAYSCKRKTELLKHMQLKHSTGKDPQPLLYQCKFCSYSTKYRQALQNHENCKHTRNKEFRCALCTYITFSNTGLFLHKRKAHGYVPGDLKWLETYAEKERQNRSVDGMQNFYCNIATFQKTVEELPGGVASGSFLKNTKQAETQYVLTNSVPSGSPSICEKSNLETVSTLKPLANAFIEETWNDQPVIHDQEQCCSKREDQEPLQNEVEIQESMPVVQGDDSPRSDALYEAIPNESETEHGALSDSEKDSVIEERAQDGGNQMIEKTSTTQESSSLTEAAGSANLLQIMRRQDKDQAEALILEGRVQMFVVQTQCAVYRCERCSYVTRKQAALVRHCRSQCQVMKAALQCQDCGLRFKQLRSLNNHCLKKCCAVQKKKRKVAGLKGNETLQGQNANNDEDRYLSSTVTVTDLCKQLTQDGNEDSNAKTIQDANGSSPAEYLAGGEICGYHEHNGKFRCRTCSFSCSRKTTMAHHCTVCSKRNLVVNKEGWEQENETDGDSEQPHEQTTGGKVEGMTKKQFSCTNCPFVCQQQRALTSHEKRGCLKPGEIQCQHCSFVARSVKALNHHVLVHGKDKTRKQGKQTQLCCKLCPFTCKQERRMSQHVALKHEGVRPFCCRFCNFSTARRHRLDAHESGHTGVGRHKCELCSQTFGTSSKLRLHHQRIHDKQATHFCSLCDFKGYNPTDISRHTISCHIGDLSHRCDQCDACFSSIIALRQHCKRTHATAGTHRCTLCSFTCNHRAILRAHFQGEHSQSGNPTSRFASASQSKRSKLSLIQKCPECPFTTGKKMLLVQHMVDKHEGKPDEEKTLKCDVCGFSCVHQLVFDQHVRSHGGTCLYKCTECDFSTRNKQKITWHIRIHTGEKPYRCEKCSYACADPSRLKYHMRIHQDERKYLCQECGYKCKWINQLKYHMTKHSGVKSYACEECDYRTNRADALRVHRKMRHQEERSFICEKCGKAFKTRFLLKTHQKRHSEDRPYICSECQRSFRWPAGLRHHYLSHTKQLPFCCLHCPYRAKQKFQVVKHLQRHHPDQSKQGGVVKDPNTSSFTLNKARLGSKQGRMTENSVEDQEMNRL